MSHLTIFPRTAWKARPHKPNIEARTRSTIHELFFHWPGSDPKSWRTVDTVTEEARTLRSFQNYHMDTHGWSDIGYNHVMGSGGGRGDLPRVWEARGALYVPAAQLGHNAGTIACCVLVGPSDDISLALVSRMRSYIRYVEHMSGNRVKVLGHGDGPGQSTDCPGPKLHSVIHSGKLNIH